MLQVLSYILALQLSHSLDLVQIDHETFFVVVKLLDALPAKDSLVVGTIKMLHSLRVDVAEFLNHAVFVIVFKIKVALCQDLILLHNFVQYIDVKRQSLRTIQIFNQFSADWAPDPIVVVQLCDAICAQSMSAMN